jgi:hypothetical protein
LVKVSPQQKIALRSTHPITKTIRYHLMLPEAIEQVQMKVAQEAK